MIIFTKNKPTGEGIFWVRNVDYILKDSNGNIERDNDNDPILEIWISKTSPEPVRISRVYCGKDTWLSVEFLGHYREVPLEYLDCEWSEKIDIF